MEDFILSTQILTEFSFVKPDDYKVRAIIFLLESKKVDKIYSRKILGKEMQNWVDDSVSPIKSTFVEITGTEDCYEKAKKYMKEEDFTICLFADTPLLKNSTIMEVLDYAETKGLDFCKLPRGFIVKTQNFLSGKIEFTADVNFVDKQEFFSVFDEKTLCIAKDELRKRIIDKHLKNGVEIEDLNSISIDDSVEIEKGAVIKQNNILLGKTIIKRGVCLEPFNFVEDSIIKENAKILQSYVKNSVVKENSTVGPFEKLLNKKEK